MKKINNTQIIVLAVASIIFLSSLTGLGFRLSSMDLGYSTAFQNPKARFVGINYKGTKYSSGDVKTASSASFDTTLAFDPDTWNDGQINLEGEMTSVFVPAESLGFVTSPWIPSEWLKNNAMIQNPQKTYSWNISGKTYRMEQWLLKWYVSLSAEIDSGEATIPWGVGHPEAIGRNNRLYYENTEVWFELDLSPTWYIEGGGRAYFAIAKITLSDIKKATVDNNNQEQTADTRLSVAPESEGDPLYVFSGLFGTEGATSETYTYQGKELNPQYFRDRVYAKFRLNNFGVDEWNEYTTLKTKGDAIALGFDVQCFVIGEWDVKDIQNIDWEDWGRTAKTDLPPSLIDYLNDPKVQALITLLVTAGIFIFLLIFAPWVLIAIVAMFSGRRKR